MKNRPHIDQRLLTNVTRDASGVLLTQDERIKQYERLAREAFVKPQTVEDFKQ